MTRGLVKNSGSLGKKLELGSFGMSKQNGHLGKFVQKSPHFALISSLGILDSSMTAMQGRMMSMFLHEPLIRSHASLSPHSTGTFITTQCSITNIKCAEIQIMQLSSLVQTSLKIGDSNGVLLGFEVGAGVKDPVGTHSPSPLHIPAEPSCKFKKS